MNKIPSLSIWQPWAWLIVNGHKDLENRVWATKHRGLMLVHAGKRIDPNDAEIRRWVRTELGIVIPENLPTGGVVGGTHVTGMETTPVQSPWWMGPVAWKLERSFVLPFHEVPGRQKLFGIQMPSSIARLIPA